MTDEEKTAVLKALWEWGQNHKEHEKNVLYTEEKMYAVKFKGMDFIAIIKADSMFEALAKVEQDILNYNTSRKGEKDNEY